jgi:hypothetical protein
LETFLDFLLKFVEAPKINLNPKNAGISCLFFRLLVGLSGGRNAWLGRKGSDLDMAISKADALACSRGFEEPISSGCTNCSKQSTFENRTELAESRVLERIGLFGDEWAGSSD